MQAFAAVVRFCTARACRRAMLLAHFGERLRDKACTGCDWCQDAQEVELQVRPGANCGRPIAQQTQ